VKKMFFTIMILLLNTLARAQHPSHHVPDDPKEVEPFERGFPQDYRLAPNNPEVTTGIQKYAIDEKGKPQKNFGISPIHDNRIFGFLFIDRLEERWGEDRDTILWDATGRIGNDYHKLFLETEGKYNAQKGSFKESRNELLYGYNIASFWNIQGGYRRDFIKDRDDREFAVLSLQGMAPFTFEVDAATYLSDEGDLSAILELEYSFLLTQRTQLIPRFETEISLQEVQEYNIGRGVNGFELGLRLSYQIKREIAPYLGVSWEKKLFETQNLLESSGEDTNEAVFLIGARLVI
jgi:copper resistance protein B